MWGTVLSQTHDAIYLWGEGSRKAMWGRGSHQGRDGRKEPYNLRAEGPLAPWQLYSFGLGLP